MKHFIFSFLVFILFFSQSYAQWYSQIPTFVSSNFQYLQFVDYDNGWAIGDDHKLFKTTNGGSDWVDMGVILPEEDLITSVYFLNTSIGWLSTYKLIGDSAHIYKTTDGGLNWFLQPGSYSYIIIKDIWFADGMTGYMAANGGLGTGFIYKTTDGGDNWTSLINPGASFLTSSLAFINSDTGWAAGGNILKTTDGGTSWVEQLNIEPSAFTSIYFVDAMTGWAATHTSIYKTVDSGSTWFLQKTIQSQKVFFIDTINGWLVNGADIYHTNDGGDNWVLQNSTSYYDLNDIFFIDSLTGWAAGNHGTILHTENGGSPYGLDFSDNFDEYTAGQQLACQNPDDWTTWNLAPCSVEDPYINSALFYSYPNSVKIIEGNDLIKSLEYISSNRNYVNFRIYIPTGKAGYFSILSDFNSSVQELGVECYFDADGTGRLMSVPDAPVTFIYTPGEWHYVQVAVDLDQDEAEFWFDGLQKYTWQWSQNGTVSGQLAANNFYGNSSLSEFYIDDYLLNSNCLYCTPPSAPENLAVQEIFDTEPVLQLNWEFNYMAPGFKILRKSGLPEDPGSYTQIGTSVWNVNQFTDSLVMVDSTYTYGVMAYNIYGNSDTSNLASITVLPLPVELVSFNADITENGVSLNWITATETNNRGFEIQRSKTSDQAGEEGAGWSSIGFVDGNGTTTQKNTYMYKDIEINPGKYSYRLKQIDFDGSYEYSQEIEVEVAAPAKFALEQNYPNPFNPVTTINYQLPQSGFVTLKVYDVLGNEAASLVNEQKNPGKYSVDFDASKLASGVYIYQLRVNEYLSSKKMLLLK